MGFSVEGGPGLRGFRKFGVGFGVDAISVVSVLLYQRHRRSSRLY